MEVLSFNRKYSFYSDIPTIQLLNVSKLTQKKILKDNEIWIKLNSLKSIQTQTKEILINKLWEKDTANLEGNFYFSRKLHKQNCHSTN